MESTGIGNLTSLTCASATHSPPQSNSSPLHVAAQHGHLDVVRLLLDRGASKEAANNVGSSLCTAYLCTAHHNSTLFSLFHWWNLPLSFTLFSRVMWT